MRLDKSKVDMLVTGSAGSMADQKVVGMDELMAASMAVYWVGSSERKLGLQIGCKQSQHY